MAALTPTFSDSEKGLGLPAAPLSPSPASSFAAKKYDGLRGRAVRTMDFLVEHGVEERGIQPRPEDVSCSNSVGADSADGRNASPSDGGPTSPN